MTIDPEGLDALRTTGAAAGEDANVGITPTLDDPPSARRVIVLDGVEVDVSRLADLPISAAELPRSPTAAETALVRSIFGPGAIAVPLPGRLGVIGHLSAPGTAQHTQEGTQ